MATGIILETPPIAPTRSMMISHEVLELVNEQSVISLDTLVTLLPQFEWNQIFHAVDQLARERRLVLRRHRFDYTIFSASYAA